MYESEKSEEYWKEQAREMGAELGVDIREGSVYMDAATGHCIRTAKFYSDLDLMHEMISPDTASGEILKEYAMMDSVMINDATPSVWSADFVGATPNEGTQFLCDEYYFTWKNVNGEMRLESQDLGEITNSILPHAELIPLDNIESLESARIGTLIIPGKEAESDDIIREKWKESKNNPKANSNVSQLRMLCEEFNVVGRARILALWGGENTVKAVLYSKLGKDIPDVEIQNIQQAMDPIEKGYVVTVKGQEYIFGDGLGEGAVGIGLHFLAASATPVSIRVSAEVKIQQGYQMDSVASIAKAKMEEYAGRLALDSPEKNSSYVTMANIGSIITETEGVEDYRYDSLTINNGRQNIEIDVESVAIITEVVFNAYA